MKWWVYAGFWLGLGACAAPAQQVAVAPSRPVATAKLVAQPAFAERATFVAVEPAGATIWVHIPTPARDLPVLGQLTGMGGVLDPTELLAKVLGPTTVSAIDLEQPVDIGLSLDNEALVMAYGLRSQADFVEQTRSAFELVPIANGRWRVSLKHADAEAKLSCEVWQGAAPARARLMCSENASAIGAQGAFFMSKAASAHNDVSAHAELPRAAMAYLIAQATHTDEAEKATNSASEEAGAQAGRALVDQFGKEVASLAWDVTLREAAVDVSEHVELSKAQSLAALAIAGQPAPHAAVPDAFWNLPGATDVAWYSEGADATRFRAAWSPLAKQFIEEAAADYVAKPDYWTSIQHEFEALFCRGGAYVVAHGADLPALGKALSVDLAPAKSAKNKAQLTRLKTAVGGWFLVGVKDDSKPLMAALQRFVPLMNEHVPRRKDAKPEKEDATDDHVSMVPLTKPGDLPKGSLHWLIRLEPNPKYVEPADGSSPRPPPSKLHVIAAVQGDYVWLAFAGDEASASTRLRALLAPNPADTLGTHAELRALAPRSVSSFGFATIGAYAGLRASADSNQEVLASRRLLSLLSTLPSNGSTPIPFWSDSSGTLEGPRSVTLTVRLAPNAIADLLQLAIANADPR